MSADKYPSTFYGDYCLFSIITQMITEILALSLIVNENAMLFRSANRMI